MLPWELKHERKIGIQLRDDHDWGRGDAVHGISSESLGLSLKQGGPVLSLTTLDPGGIDVEGAGVDPLAYVPVLVGFWPQFLQRHGLGTAVESLYGHACTHTQQGSLSRKGENRCTGQ